MSKKLEKELKDIEKEPITVIETDIWQPIKDTPGYLEKVRNKTINEVYIEVKEFLKEQGVYDELDYFNISFSGKETEDFPAWRWIACYAVVGGSEGHYLHVDVIPVEGATKTVFVGKTFLGMDHALKVSNLLTKAFWNEM